MKFTCFPCIICGVPLGFLWYPLSCYFELSSDLSYIKAGLIYRWKLIKGRVHYYIKILYMMRSNLFQSGAIKSVWLLYHTAFLSFSLSPLKACVAQDDIASRPHLWIYHAGTQLCTLFRVSVWLCVAVCTSPRQSRHNTTLVTEAILTLMISPRAHIQAQNT